MSEALELYAWLGAANSFSISLNFWGSHFIGFKGILKLC